MEKTDVLIIGGGPAGAMLGHYLSEKGIANTIIERFGKGRDKVCAGGIPFGITKFLPENLSQFKRVEYNKFSIFYKGNISSSSKSDKPFLYGVMRKEFDQFLREGLNVHYNETFLSFSEEKDGIIAKTNREMYHAKFLIGADGVGSRVSILSKVAPKKRFIVAEEKEVPFDSQFNQKEVRIYLGYNFLGYGWVFPKEEVLSVGAGSLKKYFKRGASNKIVPNSAKAKIYPISLWGGREKLTNGRVALVGEAGNLVDPFTAGGVYPAILSARLAADIIQKKLSNGQSNLDDYNELLDKYLYPDFSYALVLSKMFYPFIPVIKKYIVKESTIRLALTSAINKGYISYKDFYSRVKSSKHLSLKIAYFLVKKFAK